MSSTRLIPRLEVRRVFSTDGLLAGLIGLVALFVYLRTIYPGLVGTVDSAKLQFVGRVLGTPHNPGYPLFVLVSHAFSHIPLGSLAFRINLMSAVFGAITTGVVYLTARTLGSRRAAAGAAALGLAFGATFWSQAIVAEVYTLSTALIAGVVWMLVKWKSEKGTTAHLYWATGLYALSLGNHLTVVLIAPAILLYVMMSELRVFTRVGLLVRVTVLLVLGFGQYGFILLRTYQGASYLESRATNLTELWDVIRGAQFSSLFMAFDSAQVLPDRLALMGRWFVNELGLLSTGLAILGVIALGRRSVAALTLLGVGIVAITAFAVSYGAGDIEVFLLPAFLLTWLLVAFGMQGLGSLIERHSPAAAHTAVGLIACLVPLGQLKANYAVNDHHQRVYEIRYFDALFESAQDRSAIVSDRYFVDQFILYKLLGEESGRSKEIVHLPRTPEVITDYWRRGFTIYTFETARRQLSTSGFRFSPVQLDGWRLDRYLEAVQNNHIVLIASGRGLGGQSRDFDLGGIGGDHHAIGPGHFAAIGVGRARGKGELMHRMRGDVMARLDVRPVDIHVRAGEQLANTGVVAPIDLQVSSSPEGGRVIVGGREIVGTPTGLVFAILKPDGGLVEQQIVEPPDFLVPIDMRPLPLYRVTWAPECQSIGNLGWIDVTRQTSGGSFITKLDNFGPFNSSLIAYISANSPLDPQLSAVQGPRVPTADVQEFALNDRESVRTLRSSLERDGLIAGGQLERARLVYRLSLEVNDGGDFSNLTFTLGGAPMSVFALARVDRDHPQRAMVCASKLTSALFADNKTLIEELDLDDESGTVFGPGWHGIERRPLHRWTAQEEAEIRVALKGSRRIRIAIDARPPVDQGSRPVRLSLRVNDTETAAQVMEPQGRTYHWVLPESAWKKGVNRMFIRVSNVATPAEVGLGRDKRQFGVSVARVRFELLE